MANKKPNLPPLVDNTQIDSESVYEERPRQGFVQGSADGVYGSPDGFRYGFDSTGMRHKQSSLGKIVRRGT